MENQSEEQDEGSLPVIPAAPIQHTSSTDAPEADVFSLHYYHARKNRGHIPAPIHVPDWVTAVGSAAIAVAMGWCAWLSINSSVPGIASYSNRYRDAGDGSPPGVWAIRIISLMFLAMMCGACYSARTYWLRWRRRGSFITNQIDGSDFDSPPIAMRADEPEG